jgi:hypothetical protein
MVGRLVVLVLLVVGMSGIGNAFSDDELRAIYAQMKPGIRCGTTVEHLIAAYKQCVGTTMCDASIIDAGCHDKLIIEDRGGPDPIITLNGVKFPLPPPPSQPLPKKAPPIAN